MRVLLLTQDYPPAVGGIQTFARELASRLRIRCTGLRVLAPAHPGDGAFDRRSGVATTRVRCRPERLPAALLPALVRHAVFGRADVALHMQWQAALPSLLVRAICGRPRRIVVMAHGRELLHDPVPGRVAGRIYGMLRRWTLKNSDRLCANSRFTAGLLEAGGVAAGRVAVVGCGTDPDRYCPGDRGPARRRLNLPGGRILFTLCRLTPHKGIDTAIRAVARLGEMQDLFYLVGGTGPDRERLATLAAGLGVGERVRFLGKVEEEELADYYRACDLFAMLSRRDGADVEGLGIAFLDAAACGRPVLGTRSGGIPDAVEHGRTGLLVEPGNADEAAAGMRKLLDRGYADRLGRQGRSRVEEGLTWELVCGRVHRVLVEVAGTHPE